MVPARLLTAVALAAGVLACTNVGAQPVVRPVAPARDALQPVVPASAGAFVTLRVSDFAKHPDLKQVLTQLAQQPDALAQVTEVIGVAPSEIDRITLFWPRVRPRGGSEPVLVVTTNEPFNEARTLKNLRAVPVFDGDRRFGAGPRRFAPQLKGGVKDVAPGFNEEAAPGFKGAERPGSGPAEPKLEPLPPSAGGGEESLCAAALDGGDIIDPLFYLLDRSPFSALFLVDERTLVFLPGRSDGEFASLALLSASLKKNATGPLAEALAAASKHTLAAGVYLPPLFREFDRRVPPDLVPYTALLAARTAVLTGDLEKAAKFSLALKFEDAAAAKRAAPVLEEGLGTVTTVVGTWAAELSGGRRPVERALAPMAVGLVEGMKKAKVTVDGSNVTASTEVDAGPAIAKALGELIQSVQSRRKAALRTNNLKQIGLALHSYHDTYGRFPANVYGPKGELLLSWRVQLLPYLEQDALYRQFKMDEPWDGPNNKRLIESMPKAFQAPDRDHAKGETYYQAFVERKKPNALKRPFGRPWLKEGEKGGIAITSITDGTSNTLAVIEAGEGVIWSKPDDLPFGGAVPPLGEKGWDRTPALRFDGSVLLFPTNLKPDVFWQFVTIDGGEMVPDLEDERGAPFGTRPPAPAGEPAVDVPIPRERSAAPGSAGGRTVEGFEVRLAGALAQLRGWENRRR